MHGLFIILPSSPTHDDPPNQVPRISLEVAELPSEAADGTSWGLPNAAQRKQAGGGVQGTASTVQEVEAANKACQQWTWKPLIAELPLRRGYKV